MGRFVSLATPMLLDIPNLSVLLGSKWTRFSQIWSLCGLVKVNSAVQNNVPLYANLRVKKDIKQVRCFMAISMYVMCMKHTRIRFDLNIAGWIKILWIKFTVTAVIKKFSSFFYSPVALKPLWWFREHLLFKGKWRLPELLAQCFPPHTTSKQRFLREKEWLNESER